MHCHATWASLGQHMRWVADCGVTQMHSATKQPVSGEGCRECSGGLVRRAGRAAQGVLIDDVVW